MSSQCLADLSCNWPPGIMSTIYWSRDGQRVYEKMCASPIWSRVHKRAEPKGDWAVCKPPPDPESRDQKPRDPERQLRCQTENVERQNSNGRYLNQLVDQIPFNGILCPMKREFGEGFHYYQSVPTSSSHNKVSLRDLSYSCGNSIYSDPQTPTPTCDKPESGIHEAKPVTVQICDLSKYRKYLGQLSPTDHATCPQPRETVHKAKVRRHGTGTNEDPNTREVDDPTPPSAVSDGSITVRRQLTGNLGDILTNPGRDQSTRVPETSLNGGWNSKYSPDKMYCVPLGTESTSSEFSYTSISKSQFSERVETIKQEIVVRECDHTRTTESTHIGQKQAQGFLNGYRQYFSEKMVAALRSGSYRRKRARFANVHIETTRKHIASSVREQQVIRTADPTWDTRFKVRKQPSPNLKHVRRTDVWDSSGKSSSQAGEEQHPEPEVDSATEYSRKIHRHNNDAMEMMTNEIKQSQKSQDLHMRPHRRRPGPRKQGGPDLSLRAHTTPEGTTEQDVHILCNICPNRGLFLCSGCRKVAYCSELCQTVNWTAHKERCQRGDGSALSQTFFYR